MILARKVEEGGVEPENAFSRIKTNSGLRISPVMLSFVIVRREWRGEPVLVRETGETLKQPRKEPFVVEFVVPPR
jgi:hypothetical protein